MNPEGMPIAWEQYPPDAELAYYPVLSPQGQRPLRAIILASPLIGCYTHWWTDRTVPCLGPSDQWPCPGCQRHLERRWKGYLACYEPGLSRSILMEVTANSARLRPELLDPAQNLRGSILELHRLPGRKNAPVEAKLLIGTHRGTLPAPFDVKAALLRLWGADPYLGSPGVDLAALPPPDETPWGSGDPAEQERAGGEGERG